VRFHGEGDCIMRLLMSLVFIGFSLIHPLAWAGIAGEVTLSSGEVHVGKLTGAAVSAGTQVNEGDALTTGADGYLHIKLVDNGLLILRPNSSVVVSAYARDADNPAQSRMRIDVARGAVRSVTGAWGKAAPKNFRLNTPVAALGVRGTDFTVFTTADVTRAAVASGGIVMTPLGGACSASGVEPCEGALSAELFAGNQFLVLQARAGGAKAEIIDGRHLDMHSEKAAPPTPAGSPAAPSGKDASLLYPGYLDPTALEALLVGAASPAPAPTRIKWGRWEALLDPSHPSDIPVDRSMVAVNAKFALFRDNAPAFVMPHEGTASFRLDNQESFFYDAASRQATPASISNAKLSVDFVAQTFATAFTMQNSKLSTYIQANGGLLPDGRFISSIISSNASVSGVLAGTNASEAGFLFHQPVTPGITAYGATHWAR
jgi:hypothetical protein